MQKCEPAARNGRPGRVPAGREWGHLGPMTDQSFDCDIAATLVAGHLGRPPLLGFDSTEDAGWPGTGLWKKGKASPGLIQALQSLPLPVFVASALRNVDDRRRNTKSLLRRCACPEFFNQHLPLRNFCLCTFFHSPSTNSSPLHQLSTTFWLRSNPITTRGDKYLQRTFDLVFDFVLAFAALASLAKSSLAFELVNDGRPGAATSRCRSTATRSSTPRRPVYRTPHQQRW
jgi:hypothetical protein